MALPATRHPSTSLCGSWRMISRSLHVPGSPSSAFTTRYFGLRREDDKRIKTSVGHLARQVKEVQLTGRRWACSWSPTSSLWGSQLLLDHADQTLWSRWGSSPLPSPRSLWSCTSRRDSSHLSAWKRRQNVRKPFRSINTLLKHCSSRGIRVILSHRQPWWYISLQQKINY